MQAILFLNVRNFDYNNATDGMKLFAWGMFKKLCIADRIAVYVNYVYGNVNDGYGVAILLATVLYSFQIYCDFSGYSDMAIGIARYLGFDVGKNFDHPYLSKSVGLVSVHGFEIMCRFRLVEAVLHFRVFI